MFLTLHYEHFIEKYGPFLTEGPPAAPIMQRASILQISDIRLCNMNGIAQANKALGFINFIVDCKIISLNVMNMNFLKVFRALQ